MALGQKGRRMRQGEFISLKVYVIVGCFAAITPADLAHAQPKSPTAAEGTLAVKIKCKDFQENSDGKWTSSSNATIGKIDFSSHTFGVGEVDIGGADLATVLDRKCVAH
jgi:hypothetical protein